MSDKDVVIGQVWKDGDDRVRYRYLVVTGIANGKAHCTRVESETHAKNPGLHGRCRVKINLGRMRKEGVRGYYLVSGPGADEARTEPDLPPRAQAQIDAPLAPAAKGLDMAEGEDQTVVGVIGRQKTCVACVHHADALLCAKGYARTLDKSVVAEGTRTVRPDLCIARADYVESEIELMKKGQTAVIPGDRRCSCESAGSCDCDRRAEPDLPPRAAAQIAPQPSSEQPGSEV